MPVISMLSLSFSSQGASLLQSKTEKADTRFHERNNEKRKKILILQLFKRWQKTMMKRKIDPRPPMHCILRQQNLLVSFKTPSPQLMISNLLDFRFRISHSHVSAPPTSFLSALCLLSWLIIACQT